MRLKRDFFIQDSYSVSIALLGKVLCINKAGKIEKYRIVETEAYGGITDRASHSFNNTRTKRTEAMYLMGGHVYIYLIYGMYYMLNIVANINDVPEAVLIRAVEPLDVQDKKINTNGPGKLCKQLDINKSHNLVDLVTSDVMYLEDDDYMIKDYVTSKRINIDYAGTDKDRLWRFYIKDNRHVSKK